MQSATSVVSSMALCKRQVAGVIFSMILLCTELSRATKIENSDEACTSSGDYCFVKQRGFAFYKGKDMMVVVHINASLSVEHCMETCKRYLCSAFLVFNVSFGSFSPPPACTFFLTMPDITEFPLFDFDVYVHRSKVPPPAPATLPTPGPAQEVPNPTGQPKENTVKNQWRWLLGAVLTAIATCFLAVTCYLWNKTARNSQEEAQGETKPNCIPSLTRRIEESEKLGEELQRFRFKSISTATNQFSGANKIGEGGFGPVYKASLRDGQEVAVKRLSRSSSQGLGEFRNEIKLIASLQHTNLVRLLGCCLEGNEKMLVYEFMPNKSLDSILFDPTKKKVLDWKKRLDIIEGTAQGLLYLHKHSRVKVIHRDLKTSNILLDINLKPKISDFGMARIFEQTTSEANTNRVVGTYGYMSPEYAMAGLYSEKSDVFSFGVIVLEIMSGKKATSFSGAEYPFNLIRCAWDLWKEEKSLELVDPTISEIYDTEELLRHIHVGLLCVEESVADRPTMSDVLSMLTNNTIALSDPKQPAFYCGKSTSNTERCSPNLVTLSPVEAR